jgi:hypothetical protein
MKNAWFLGMRNTGQVFDETRNKPCGDNDSLV